MVVPTEHPAGSVTVIEVEVDPAVVAAQAAPPVNPVANATTLDVAHVNPAGMAILIVPAGEIPAAEVAATVQVDVAYETVDPGVNVTADVSTAPAELAPITTEPSAVATSNAPDTVK